MSAAGYAWGVVALVVVLLAIADSARGLRRRLLPAWEGAPARLAELVLGTSVLLVLLELLGVLGVLVRPALVGASLVTAVLVRLVRRTAAPSPARQQLDRPGAGAWLAIAAVLTQWLTSIRFSSRHGIDGVDALHYHLPFAAHFVQDHSITTVHRLDALGDTTWYPLNSELLHAAGMVLLRTDVLSLVLDLVSFAAVLLAVWVLASAYGAGTPALIATCVLLGVMGPVYAGSAMNDWFSVWPLVAALAVLAVSRTRSLPVVLVAGLACGIAVGTKLTMLAPAACVLALVLLLGRLRAAFPALLAMLATGGFWYARDLAVTGNPFPLVPDGLPRPATPDLDALSYSVLHYLGNGSVVHRWYVPGLRWYLGPGWVVVLVLTVIGLLLPLWRRRTDPVLVAASAAGLLGLAVYLLAPTGAAGARGVPYLFQYNIRYALITLLLGLLLLVVVTAPSRWVNAVLAGLLLVTLVRHQAWVTGWWSYDLVKVALVLVVLLVLRRLSPKVLLTGVVVLLLLVPSFEKRYDARAYAGGSGQDALVAAVGASGQRVGIVGRPIQYPYFGRRLGNRVSYVGHLGADESFTDITSCREFAGAVNRQRLTFVVVQVALARPVPRALAWLRHDPVAQQVVGNDVGWVFAISGPLSCP